MRNRQLPDTLTLDLFADQSANGQEVLQMLQAFSDAGLLRRLDSALAHFVHELAPESAPCVFVATALLAQMEGRGHSCLPLVYVPTQPNAVLAWPADALGAQQALWRQLPQALSEWLHALRACAVVRVVGRDSDAGQPLVLAGHDGPQPLLYLRRYWGYERQVAQHIQRRSQLASVPNEAAALYWLQKFFPTREEGATDWQQLACAVALRGRLAVITGGPGTGKTYVAARLLALLFATAPDAQRLRVALAAPTGKAAARLKQSIDRSLKELTATVGAELDLNALVQRVGAARTLHSLLGARPDTRHWGRHAGNVLDVDVLLVDEASMVHLEMMAALLDALPPTARLVLLGDKDQLDSVEAGAVLGDLCRDAQAGRYSQETADYLQRVTTQKLPAQWLDTQAPAPLLAQQTVMLRDSHRFSGPIKQLALAVNAGDAPQAYACLQAGVRSGSGAQVWMQEGGDAASVCDLAIQGRGSWPGYAHYVRELRRWPEVRASADVPQAHAQWVRSVLHSFDRFRLLCAVREGEWGVAGLNRAVEKMLEQQRSIQKNGEWYAGRPVMVTRNDVELGVFNGDIGMALPSAGEGHPLRAWFLQGEELRSVSVARLAHVETAYAMTVHKSQGSEFEHTALVLSAHAGHVLNRALLYTGITRASKAFSLLAQKPGLLASAVGSPSQRASGLLRFMDGTLDQ